MFVVIAIILFLGFLTTGFVNAGGVIQWILLGLAVVSLIVHFILRAKRRAL